MTFSFVVDLGAISHELADCIEIERGKEGFKLTRAAAEAAEAERQRIWGRIRELRAQRA
jgi:hypothetical protein